MITAAPPRRLGVLTITDPRRVVLALTLTLTDPRCGVLTLTLTLGSEPHVVDRLESGMRVSASFQIISRPVGWLGLGLGSGPYVVGRLGSGVRVSASFQLR